MTKVPVEREMLAAVLFPDAHEPEDVEEAALALEAVVLAEPQQAEPVAWHSDEREKEMREAAEFMRMLKDDESLPSNIRASGAMLEARFERLTGDEFVPVDYLLERERLLHRALKAHPPADAPTANDTAMRLLRECVEWIGPGHPYWEDDHPGVLENLHKRVADFLTNHAQGGNDE